MSCWALVTGGTSGVGLALARGLAREGCSLILSSRNLDRLGKARRILLQYTHSVHTVKADLRIREDVEELVEEALRVSEHSLRVAVLSYGNPICEPSTLDEAPWTCWTEAASLYLASTSTLISRIAKNNSIRATVAAVSSFTVESPHPPLIVADTVRRGLPSILSVAAKKWPAKIQTVLIVLGSFRTPGAEETISILARGDVDRFWRENVEALSPLGRAGEVEELERLAGILLRLPEYVVYTPLYIDGGSMVCVTP